MLRSTPTHSCHHAPPAHRQSPLSSHTNGAPPAAHLETITCHRLRTTATLSRYAPMQHCAIVIPGRRTSGHRDSKAKSAPWPLGDTESFSAGLHPHTRIPDEERGQRLPTTPRWLRTSCHADSLRRVWRQHRAHTDSLQQVWRQHRADTVRHSVSAATPLHRPPGPRNIQKRPSRSERPAFDLEAKPTGAVLA